MDQGDIEMKSEVHEELQIKDEPIDQFSLSPSPKNMPHQKADIRVLGSVLSSTENTNFKDALTCQAIKQETSETCGKSKIISETEKLEESNTFVQKTNPNHVCNVCTKECLNENELALHKKRHKLDSPLICKYCSQTYTNRHRYEVHVRSHTGETPFKCHICGKGFRDDRKMRLHVARHDGSLPNKCDLCPRSFEGPKALEKHKEAHRIGRFVQPKVIINADGSKTMALPTEAGVGGPGIGFSTVLPPAKATVPDSSLTTPMIGTEGQMNLTLANLQPILPRIGTSNLVPPANDPAFNSSLTTHVMGIEGRILFSVTPIPPAILPMLQQHW